MQSYQILFSFLSSLSLNNRHEHLCESSNSSSSPLAFSVACSLSLSATFLPNLSFIVFELDVIGGRLTVDVHFVGPLLL